MRVEGSKVPFDPRHTVWVLEWSEPTAGGTYKTRQFRDYSKAVAEFERLDRIPDLLPTLSGFSH